LIVFLFPREGKFQYSFVEGRPWRYGLLTAPFDFPIYKTSVEIQREQDSITRNFQPYFHLDDGIVSLQIDRFREDAKRLTFPVEELTYRLYIERMLKEIYNKGIVGSDERKYLPNNQSDKIMVSRDSVFVSQSFSSFFTVKSAYSYLLSNCPPHLNVDVLRMFNLNSYLFENIKYDEVASERVKQDILQKLSLSNGMVQAGEKIADRGEIVNEQTYNILRSLKLSYERQTGTVQRRAGILAGSIVLIGGLMACFFCYLYYMRRKIYKVRKDVIFSLSMITLFSVLTEVCVKNGFLSVYIIPYAIIPIVVRTFFDSRTAIIAHNLTTLICALMVPLAFEFFLLQFTICLVAIYVLKDLTKRSELMKCAVYILAAYILVYVGLLLFQEGSFSKLDWYMPLYFGINFLFVLFTYPFIYILEKLFGYISNVTLVELSDINTPVLRQLSESCPGTFQHSLQVSMLGTAAAVKVDANPQLIRTGALYHDLGKMVNPNIFIENRIEGLNPLENLNLEQSARIITNHVPDGVKIAEKHNIPEAIIKFIKTHHGKGKAKFFYNSFKNQFPDAAVNEEAFSYSGNNPDSKETAILMMADSVEAASRSLKSYTEESIRNLVNKIIDTQIADGLMDDAPLTFKNITTIKNVFVERLLSVYHARISYPEVGKTGQEINQTGSTSN
jgi:putative nucleotidyltransferase with HDIG domain